MATTGDLHLATSGDFLMATDTRRTSSGQSHRRIPIRNTHWRPAFIRTAVALISLVAQALGEF